MNKLNRRKFIGTGIAGGIGFVILPGIGCKTDGETNNDKIGVTDSFTERDIPDWLRYPRFYTLDTRHGVQIADLKNHIPVIEGSIANLVKKIADNGGTAFRIRISMIPTALSSRTPCS